MWEIVSGEWIAETAWRGAMSQPSHYIEKKQAELPKHRSSHLTSSMQWVCLQNAYISFHEQTLRNIFNVAIPLQVRSRMKLRIPQKSLLRYTVNGPLGQRTEKHHSGCYHLLHSTLISIK